MWQTKLVVSRSQLILISGFYGCFIITWGVMLHGTYLDDIIFIGSIILVLEWWRAYRYVHQIKGHFALIYDSGEVYWARQRWVITKFPIFLRYVVIMNIESRRDRRKRVLFLISDSFLSEDWRSFHYFLRQFLNIN